MVKGSYTGVWVCGCVVCGVCVYLFVCLFVCLESFSFEQLVVSI